MLEEKQEIMALELTRVVLEVVKELRLMNDLAIDALPAGIARDDWVKKAQWRRDS